MRTTIFVFLALFTSVSNLYAHGGKRHKKDSTLKPTDSATFLQEHTAGDSIHHHDEEMRSSKVTADLSDFPSIHPLIVHFAIALIIVAAGMQLLNIYLMKKEIAWIITAILFAGVLAAWLAGKNFHPHTHGISEHAKLVLDQHDKWADWTINSGIVALLLQTGNLFIFKDKRWAIGVVTLVLAVSAYSVSRAGHYGAQLVHIEGIGPQGKFLELEHHH
jgi:uncharacterized membrane protein